MIKSNNQTVVSASGPMFVEAPLGLPLMRHERVVSLMIVMSWKLMRMSVNANNVRNIAYQCRRKIVRLPLLS